MLVASVIIFLAFLSLGDNAPHLMSCDYLRVGSEPCAAVQVVCEVRSGICRDISFSGNVQEISAFPVTLDCFYERKFTVDEEGKTSEWTLIALTD